MQLSDFDYCLPGELIAQRPLERRTDSRLLHLDGSSGALRDLQFRDLGRLLTPGDLLVFNDTGPVGNELRFRDECVRHKALDLVGDLALAGCDIEGRIVAFRSGHRLNAELVRELLCEPVGARPCRRIA